MPAIFTPIGQGREAFKYLWDDSGYINPRGKDPCPEPEIPRYITPTMTQMQRVHQALSELMNIDRITFLPDSVVVELATEDNRVYEYRSLPPRVGGLILTYHHSETHYFAEMKGYARQRLLDSKTYRKDAENATLPQADTACLQDLNSGMLTPGVRLCSGPFTSRGEFASVTISATCGIRVKRDHQHFVTVSNHGFLEGSEVFHPTERGEKIGDIIDRYPELEVALLGLTPAHTAHFANGPYFQAETLRRLISCLDIRVGS